VKSRGIIYYLIITFGLAWLIWGVPLLTGVAINSSIFGQIRLAGAFAPAGAALFVRTRLTREGFGDSGLPLRLKEAWRYYLFALLLPLGVVTIIIILALVSGLGQPDFSLSAFFQRMVPAGQAPPAPGLNIWLSLILQLIISTFIILPFVFGEELGWRGYLQNRLYYQRPVASAVAAGLIWGLWYLPLNLAGYNYPGQPLPGAAIFPVSAVLLSIIFGWLFLRTGSVWVPCLAHASSVSVGVSLTQIIFSARADSLFTGYYGVLAWIPLGAFCWWLIATGQFKPREEAQPVITDENNPVKKA
jgi:membrane protease YdiL (CAAX protease family)